MEDSRKWYVVKATSVDLFTFLQSPFSEFEPILESNPSGFLRGFFTAEGNPTTSVSRKKSGSTFAVDICVSCTEGDYMRFARHLLEHLGFHPTQMTLAGRKGSRTNLSVRQHDELQFRLVRLDEVSLFLKTIGFADGEKPEKAAIAVDLIERHGTRGAAGMWPRLYELVGRSWKKRFTSLP